MRDDERRPTRRRYLAGAAGTTLAGLAGCLGLLDDVADDEPTTEEGHSLAEDGPLAVTDLQRADDGGHRTVGVAATVENDGDEAREVVLNVELGHTAAEGAIDRQRELLLPPGATRTPVVAFAPQFHGNGDPTSDGEFRFDASFDRVTVVDDYPGLPPVTERSAVTAGSSWPSTAYDAGATAYNPATTAPRSRPSSAWTAPVDHAYAASGPVVAGDVVYAGQPVRALSTDDGTERWVHTGSARVGELAASADVVAFGTVDDFRGVDPEDGELRWTVDAAGGNWIGGATVHDGRVFSWTPRDQGAGGYATDPGRLYAIDAASGDVEWTVDTLRSLLGPPPVADGVVLGGGDPLTAFDVADGSVRWRADGGGATAAAAVAYDTVFALESERLVAIDLAEGRTRWTTPGQFHEGRIAVGGGAVFAQTDGNAPVAVDAETGERLWTCTETERILGPLSASDGVLVAQNETGPIYGVDAATGDLLWTTEVSTVRPQAVAVADGVCYVNGSDGSLHALAVD